MGRAKAPNINLFSSRRSEETEMFLNWTDNKLAPGVIDNEAKWTYLTGHCHSLALALEEIYGWQIGMIEDIIDKDIKHIFSILPDGRIADIQGIHDGDKRTWVKELGYFPETHTVHDKPDKYEVEMYLEEGWLPTEFEITQSFAKTLFDLSKQPGSNRNYLDKVDYALLPVHGPDGKLFQVTPGVINEESIQAFTRGHCHSLALELAHKHDWEIAIVSDKVSGMVSHIFNVTSDGRMIDIEGIYEGPEESWAEALGYDKDYNEITRNVKANEIETHYPESSWADPDYELASLFSEVVRQYTDLPGTNRNVELTQ